MPLKTLIKGKVIFPLIALGVVSVLLVIIALIAYTLSNFYSTQANVLPEQREIIQSEFGKRDFFIRRLTITDLDENCTLEVLQNGYVSKTCADSAGIKARKIFSNEKIRDLFTSLSRGDFDSLADSYFSEDLNIQIIVETNYGTKTITVNSSGQEDLTEELQDLIEEAEEIEEEVEEPTPSPPPPPPSPSPSPNPTPSPSPSPSPTPTPPPGGGGEPSGEEPFDCSQISNTNVTVSQIRCLDPL